MCPVLLGQNTLLCIKWPVNSNVSNVRNAMEQLTTKQVVFRIAIIIAAIELFIMLMLGFLPVYIEASYVAILDAIVLVTLSTPAIYIWVVKPFVYSRDAALKQINALAHTDPLTELANRRLIFIQLEKIISSCKRHHEYASAMLIDLNGFKSINDEYGHDIGDAALVEIAKRLQLTVRSEDIVGRIGGDEFVILIHRICVEEGRALEYLLQIGEKLLNAINKTIKIKNLILQVDSSIGIRLIGPEDKEANAVLREADMAMFKAKKSGKGCVVYFD